LNCQIDLLNHSPRGSLGAHPNRTSYRRRPTARRLGADEGDGERKCGDSRRCGSTASPGSMVKPRPGRAVLTQTRVRPKNRRVDRRFQDVRRPAARRCRSRRPRISDGAWTRPLPAVYGRRIFFSGADARTHLAFFPVGPELFWQRPIKSSQHVQGALLPCAFRHIATKPAPDTST